MQVERVEGSEVLRVCRNGKRVFAEDFKKSVVGQCLGSGKSVASVAMANGVNANLVRKWIDKHKVGAQRTEPPRLLPVSVMPLEEPVPAGSSAQASTQAPDGVIEIDIGRARVRLRGVVDESGVRCVLNALMSVDL